MSGLLALAGPTYCLSGLHWIIFVISIAFPWLVCQVPLSSRCVETGGVLYSTNDHSHYRCVSRNLIELRNKCCDCVLRGIEYVLMCYSYPNLDFNIRCFLGSLSKAIDMNVEHYAKSPFDCHSGLWVLYRTSRNAYITITLSTCMLTPGLAFSWALWRHLSYMDVLIYAILMLLALFPNLVTLHNTTEIDPRSLTRGIPN